MVGGNIVLVTDDDSHARLWLPGGNTCPVLSLLQLGVTPRHPFRMSRQHE